MISERLKHVADTKCGSETKLAEYLGIPQKKLNYYRNKSPDNLWPLLPKILELFPDIRRDWLYFGEGEMLQGGGIPALFGVSLLSCDCAAHKRRRKNKDQTFSPERRALRSCRMLAKRV